MSQKLLFLSCSQRDGSPDHVHDKLRPTRWVGSRWRPEIYADAMLIDRRRHILVFLVVQGKHVRLYRQAGRQFLADRFCLTYSVPGVRVVFVQGKQESEIDVAVRPVRELSPRAERVDRLDPR